MAVNKRLGLHGKDLKAFEELTYRRQAQSINGTIRSIESIIRAHLRRAKVSGKDYDAIKQRRLTQLARMVKRVEEL